MDVPRRDPDRLLERAGVRGDPDRDQHFLIDDRVLDRIAGYGAELPGPPDTVLEVGAGTGALTDRLLAVVRRVVAVERDRRLSAFLAREFADEVAAGRLEVVAGDALDVELPPFDGVVANLPYGVASAIIFRLLPFGRPMVVMVQREFAERLTASAGTPEYGRLTVTAWWYADADILEVVPPTAFEPPPPVDSAVVRLTPTEPPGSVDAGTFDAVVRGIFTQRRKTLRNAIRNTTHLTGIDRPSAVIDALDADLLGRRPDAVTPDEYVAIARQARAVSAG